MPKFTKLKHNIKNNEGYSNKVYYDQLNYPTIGYGHLIKKSEKFLLNIKYPKKYLEALFEQDFNKALNGFKKIHKKNKLPKNIQEVLIEMIFQLGIKNFQNFKKFNRFVKKKMFYLAALEMLDSLWYIQTPKRVERLTNILLGKKNDRQR